MSELFLVATSRLRSLSLLKHKPRHREIIAVSSHELALLRHSVCHPRGPKLSLGVSDLVPT